MILYYVAPAHGYEHASEIPKLYLKYQIISKHDEFESCILLG